MPSSLATGAKPVAFGAFKYYKIAIRKGIAMQRLVELYANYGQVGFKFYLRVDGKLSLTDAIKVLVLS
jgi:HK97 family phage major capsid protein